MSDTDILDKIIEMMGRHGINADRKSVLNMVLMVLSDTRELEERIAVISKVSGQNLHPLTLVDIVSAAGNLNTD